MLAFIRLTACFSIYFSSRNPYNATERTEELQPVHNESNIKRKTGFYLLFASDVKKSNHIPSIVGSIFCALLMTLKKTGN